MKHVACFVLAAFLAIAAGCREKAAITILFAGGERGWIVPAG